MEKGQTHRKMGNTLEQELHKRGIQMVNNIFCLKLLGLISNQENAITLCSEYSSIISVLPILHPHLNPPNLQPPTLHTTRSLDSERAIDLSMVSSRTGAWMTSQA